MAARVIRSASGRRGFLAQLIKLGALAITLPIASCSQSSARFRKIGYLDTGSPGARPAELRAFQDQLHDLGYVEGQTIGIDYRYADSVAGKLPSLAEELAGLNLDAIVAYGTQAIEAARNATASSRVPIIMASSSDPVGSKLVESLARPGGRITGLTSTAPLLTGKRLQLLHEAFPAVSRIGYFWDSTNSGDNDERARLEEAAGAWGARLISLDLRGATQNFRTVLATAQDAGVEALMTFASGIINNNPEPIVEFATARGLPAIYAQQDFVTNHGGLMAYGPRYVDLYQRAAVFVDKVLKGTPPSQLPVEKPRRFELVINRQAAGSIGFALPRTLLVQVDKVV